MLSKGIAKLVQYGVESGLVPECEKKLHNEPSSGCISRR